jgi:hypothetical protein
MDFNLVSKNNVGAVATLFLVILLSQARFFNFLIDTALGRAILILFILGISYTNKILGVVAVLFIIIAFNNSDIGYLEGFAPNSPPSSTLPNSIPPNSIPPNSIPPSSTPNFPPSPFPPPGSLPVVSPDIKEKNNMKKEHTDKSKCESKCEVTCENKGIEGFNITEKEQQILRGKRSNEIPVYSNSRNQDDNVEPCDKSVFTGSYSSI